MCYLTAAYTIILIFNFFMDRLYCKSHLTVISLLYFIVTIMCYFCA